MDWTVYNFECADAAARESLLSWVESAHPLSIPDDAEAVHGSLADGDRETPADLAWIAEYAYVLTDKRVAGLLAESAAHWERAVVAEFDDATETCTETVLYRSAGGDPAEQARYEGVPERNGQDVLYRFAMAHRFRFRAFAHAQPGPVVTPLFGAFDAPVGLGWGSDLLDEFERETGVAPTAEGIELLESDPVLDKGEFYGAVEE